MKLSGVEEMEIELQPDHSIQLTISCKTAYEASIAYHDLLAAARRGELNIKLILGEVIEQEGPTT